jgi:hypothetical protein
MKPGLAIIKLISRIAAALGGLVARVYLRKRFTPALNQSNKPAARFEGRKRPLPPCEYSNHVSKQPGSGAKNTLAPAQVAERSATGPISKEPELGRGSTTSEAANTYEIANENADAGGATFDHRQVGGGDRTVEETSHCESAPHNESKPMSPAVQEGSGHLPTGPGAVSQNASPPRLSNEEQVSATPEKDNVPSSAPATNGTLDIQSPRRNSSKTPGLPTAAGPPPGPQLEQPKKTRTPRQYRAPTRTPPRLGVIPVDSDRASQTDRSRALSIDVRLLYERGGFCRITLLPRRTADLPAELDVRNSDAPLSLFAQQDEWYQDIVPDDLGNRLRKGIEWEATLPDGREVAWSLAGRDIYVLAHHDRLNGFVACPRLTIGAEHVIIGAAERLTEVRKAIELTGSSQPADLNESNGLPRGWVGLRGVVPQKAVPPTLDGDILDALRPLAELEIVMDGGIRIERQTWLYRYPPRIRLHGDVSAAGRVLIDGCEASTTCEGNYEAPGWDALGEHSIWCTAAARSYTIRKGLEAWEPWDAYTWSHGDFAASGSPAQASICGVLVFRSERPEAERRAILVPATNSIILGAKPGEVAVCKVRRDIRAELCVAYPEFEPVWALPADPTRCDKRTVHALLIGPLRAPEALQENRHAVTPTKHSTGSVHAWCAAIRAVSRKGLRTEPADGAVADMWNLYKKRARGIWRRSR